MKKLITLFGFVLALASAPAIAGPGHEHSHGHDHSHGPISAEKAAEKAMKKVAQLVKREKIPSSWSGIKPTNTEQKAYANGPEWVVTFHNKKVSDPAKQALYLFYSLDGHYIATNHTGQ